MRPLRALFRTVPPVMWPILAAALLAVDLYFAANYLQ